MSRRTTRRKRLATAKARQESILPNPEPVSKPLTSEVALPRQDKPVPGPETTAIDQSLAERSFRRQQLEREVRGSTRLIKITLLMGRGDDCDGEGGSKIEKEANKLSPEESEHFAAALRLGILDWGSHIFPEGTSCSVERER